LKSTPDDGTIAQPTTITTTGLHPSTSVLWALALAPNARISVTFSTFLAYLLGTTTEITLIVEEKEGDMFEEPIICFESLIFVVFESLHYITPQIPQDSLRLFFCLVVDVFSFVLLTISFFCFLEGIEESNES